MTAVGHSYFSLFLSLFIMTETTILFTAVADLNPKVEVIGLNNTTVGEVDPFHSVYFSRECLETILGDSATSSCTGIRFYLVAHPITDKYGATQSRPTLMAVGEDGSEIAIDPAYISNKPCPPYCPKGGGLSIDIPLTTTTSI